VRVVIVVDGEAAVMQLDRTDASSSATLTVAVRVDNSTNNS